jgi:hypothetical protein
MIEALTETTKTTSRDDGVEHEHEHEHELERAHIDGIDAEASTPVAPPKARTTTVLVILAAAAVTISYLIAYALTNTLVTAGLMKQWEPGHDPRPRNMLVGFCVLMFTFLLLGIAARWLSRRQLRSIEQLDDDEDENNPLLQFATAPKEGE